MVGAWHGMAASYGPAYRRLFDTQVGPHLPNSCIPQWTRILVSLTSDGLNISKSWSEGHENIIKLKNASTWDKWRLTHKAGLAFD